MERGTPIGEISQHYSEVYGTWKDADTKTTNTSRGSFSEISGSNDGRLSNSETHDKSSSKDLAIAAVWCDKYDYSDNPDDAELTSSPQTTWKDISFSFKIILNYWEHTNFVTSNECNECPTNTANLDHCRDVPDPVRKLSGI